MAHSLARSKVLLVEGKDEENFFKALFKKYGVQDIDILEVGGKDKFPNQIDAFLLSYDTQVKSYAIIRDADSDPAAAFQSIVDLLKHREEPFAEKHAQYGNNEKRRVGVFIMPGNQEDGMLEDLCLQTVAEHPAMRCVEGYIACLEQALVANNLDNKRNPGNSTSLKTAVKPKRKHSWRVCTRALMQWV